jgi:sigma-B regulation protein RsbU (phosphoserine phosphatase)
MIKIFDPKDKMSRFWRLKEGSYIIGRDPDCDLFIGDDTISRRHARIEIKDDQIATITDLGSHNGTVVNGKLISDETPLSHNDFIKLGNVGLIFAAGDKKRRNKEFIDLTEDNSLSNITMLPMEKAIRQFSSGVTKDPDVFNSLFEFGKMLVIPGDNEEVLSGSLSRLKDVIPLERAAIFSLEDNGKNISLAARSTATISQLDTFSLSRTILSDLLDKKEAVLISDARIDERYAGQQSIISAGIKSAMAVPLYDEGRVFGVLYADTSNPKNRYNENHLRVLATFGNMLSAKITNNILLNERREKEILESELAVASQIQERLLPEKIPDISGYMLYAYQIQCKQVGGDLYDISELRDGRFLLMLADVSGKGTGAALLASNILAAFRALYNSSSIDILDAVRTVSNQLLAFSRPGDFATLFLALLDPRENSMCYVNAGHNPPLLARAEGKIEFLRASGIPIGMMKSDAWQEDVVELHDRDSLFIYTDGIPEAENGKGDQFGDERLIKLINENRNQSPESLSQSVMNKLYGFIGDNPRSDDITLVALKRNTE